MSEFFYSFNPYNPKNLDEVKNFTTRYINDDGDYTTAFFGYNDNKFLNEWKYPSFSYTFNNLGFRYSPLRSEADIGAFGCSYTFGQSLPNEFLWHSKLSKLTGLSVLNFGVASAGIENAVNIFCVVSKFIKLKKAIFLLPHYSRITYGESKYNKPELVNINPHDANYEFLYKTLSTEEFHRRAKLELYKAEHIAKLYNIELYYGTYQRDVTNLLNSMTFNYAKILPEWTSAFKGSEEDKARDQFHPGPLHHENWANLIKPFIE